MIMKNSIINFLVTFLDVFLNALGWLDHHHFILPLPKLTGRYSLHVVFRLTVPFLNGLYITIVTLDRVLLVKHRVR
jgi:hypothetical protein